MKYCIAPGSHAHRVNARLGNNPAYSQNIVWTYTCHIPTDIYQKQPLSQGVAVSEVCVAGPPREWDGLPNVVEARGKQNEALEAQAEAGVGHGPISAQVQVARVGLLGHPCGFQALFQNLQDMPRAQPPT